jgi:hypothetical protein
MCAIHLSNGRLGFYINAVGLHARNAGDMGVAREYLDESVRHHRNANPRNLALTLRNLADCLGRQGLAEAARRAASEALTQAIAARDRAGVVDSQAYLDWTADLLGDTRTAEQHFRAEPPAGQSRDLRREYQYSNDGIWWAGFLARTGRTQSASRLADENYTISLADKRNAAIARCRVLFARLMLTAGKVLPARDEILSAVDIFRSGDYLVELSEALTVAAEVARRNSDLDNGDTHVAEALEIAGPRMLTPAHCAALAARARIAASRFISGGESVYLHRGRDAADAALRLARGPDPLPWLELEALRAHEYLDIAAGIDLGWRDRANDLQQRLVPVDLDPDPLATKANSPGTTDTI